MKLRILSLCSLVMLLTAAWAGAQSGNMLTITPPPDRDGYVNWDLLYNDNSLAAGANNQFAVTYVAVMKFPIVVTDPCDPNYGNSVLGDEPLYSSALKLKVSYYLNYSTTGMDAVYIQLQHYTYDNDTAVGETHNSSDQHVDWATPLVENVGPEIAIRATGDKPAWDVTAQVERDRALGYKYSSFRVISTNGSGTWWSTGYYGAHFYSIEGSATDGPRLFIERGGLDRELKSPTDKEGTVSADGSTIQQSTYLLIGNNNNLAPGYRGVVKFPLANVTADVTAATLDAWGIIGQQGATTYGGAYVQLQHYLYNNNTAVVAYDGTSTEVENVGGPVFLTDSGATYFTNFENYALGTLDGQEGWSNPAWPNGEANVIASGFDGQGVQLYSASAGIWGNASRSLADETMTNNYKISFDMKVQTPPNGTTATHAYVLLYSKSADQNYLHLNFDYGYGIYILNPNKDNWMYSYVNPGTTNPFKLTLEFDWNFGTNGGYRFTTQDLVTGVVSTPYYYGNDCYGLFADYTGGAADANGRILISSSGAVMDNFSVIPEPAPLAYQIPQIPLNWDISDYIAADAAAGYDYSAFRWLPVDPAGNYFNELDNACGAYINSQHSSPLNNPNLYPRVSLSYRPVELKPTTEREGWRYTGSNGDNGSNLNWLAVGNINTLNTLCQAMIKFRLDDAVPCSNAQLKLWQNYVNPGGSGYGGVYVKLQWCTYDSPVPVCWADVDDPNYIDISGPILIKASVSEYDWDVTDQLNQAIAAGFSYCSFRVRPCDISGNWPIIDPPSNLTFQTYCCTFYTQDSSSSEPGSPWPPSGTPPANPELYPRIAVTYDPFDCGDVYEKGYNYRSDLTGDCYVNQADLAVVAEEWVGCTVPGGEGCTEKLSNNTGTIVRGTATVDGDLSDWEDALEWVPLNVNLYGDPCDVSNARFSMRWNEDTDKVYAAIIIPDSYFWFTDGYGEEDDWDGGDRLEIFSQGSGAGGAYYSTYYDDLCQQYFIGMNTPETGGTWASWANAAVLYGNPLPQFEYGIMTVGNEIHYEVGVKQYDNYAGRPGASGTTVVSDLTVNKKVRFDIVCDTRWGLGANEFGVLAANDMQAKFMDPNAIALYTLVETTPCGGWGYFASDFDLDCRVDLSDFAQFGQQWLWCNDPKDPACTENW